MSGIEGKEGRWAKKDSALRKKLSEPVKYSGASERVLQTVPI